MSMLLESAIESSVILLLALGLMPIFRGRSAALRHGVLTAALVCAAVAPLLGRVVPSWQLPAALTSLTSGTPPAVATPAPSIASASRRAGNDSASSGSQATASSVPVFAIVRSIWMIGALAGIAVLATGLAQLARLGTRARRLQHGVWTTRAESIARELGLARPVALLLSAHPSLLVTWGLLRPKVVLPSVAASWPDDRIRIVLYHELAHVRRRDWIVLVAAEALKCIYWFNPLMWVVCARLRRESEQACDDAVMNRGVEGAEYATVLVAIARDLKRRRLWLPAPAIARPSSLERRVRAMLDARINRRPVSRSAYAGVVFATAALTIAVASAQGGFASLTGSIVDPTNSVMPGVTLVLTNPQNQAKYEVRSDSSGRYEFVAVPAGEYLFEAKLPGFAAFKGTLTIGAQNLQRDLTMDIGTLQETIHVMSSRSAPAAASAPPAPRAALPKRPRPDCGSGPVSGRLQVGGHVRAPAKLKDVRPIYPAHLASQGVEGTVTLKARIGTDGMIEDLEVVSAPHADLGHAAADAVRQWEFDETLLNCKPIAVSMNVTVNFGLQRP
jgi:TonB family protein